MWVHVHVITSNEGYVDDLPPGGRSSGVTGKKDRLAIGLMVIVMESLVSPSEGSLEMSYHVGCLVVST